jgi:hypothetical protein
MHRLSSTFPQAYALHKTLIEKEKTDLSTEKCLLYYYYYLYIKELRR